MSLILVYDTETTGLPLFREPSEHKDQPHIVEIAAGLYNEAGECVDQGCHIVRPDGWVIPDFAANIHGITTERALDEGIPEAEALAWFDDWYKRAVLRVGHNQQFDERILHIAYKRFLPQWSENWRGGRSECTATLACPIVQCPPTERMKAVGRHHFKTPNLTECMRHFFDEDHAGAHGALADTLACARVYFAIKNRATAAA